MAASVRRCIYFAGSIELAWHNNLFRAFALPPVLAAAEVSLSDCSYCPGSNTTADREQPKRDLVPYGAFTGFRADFEAPKVGEGFAEVRTVNFVFEGDEEARRRWGMWLQIDGK